MKYEVSFVIRNRPTGTSVKEKSTSASIMKFRLVLCVYKRS